MIQRPSRAINRHLTFFFLASALMIILSSIALAASKNTEKFSGLAKEAKTQRELGEIGAYIKLLDEMSQIEPRHPAVLFGYGEAYGSSSPMFDKEKAVEAFTALLEVAVVKKVPQEIMDRVRSYISTLQSGKKLALVKDAQQMKKKALAESRGMILVTGGCFDMGSVFKNEGSQDERPAHNVCLGDFYIDRTEVTQADYKNVMGSNPSSNRSCASCPVEQVTWHDAQKYCSQAGKRLPTEAEWEYAARGGGEKARFGNGADKISTSDANWDGTKFYEKFSFQGENRDRSVPVASFAPNKLGITDMSGNVAEWVADWYDPAYYASSPQDNPKGPSGGDEKVIRGGGWFNNPDFLRTSKRFHLKPEYKNAWYGFRCAR